MGKKQQPANLEDFINHALESYSNVVAKDTELFDFQKQNLKIKSDEFNAEHKTITIVDLDKSDSKAFNFKNTAIGDIYTDECALNKIQSIAVEYLARRCSVKATMATAMKQNIRDDHMDYLVSSSWIARSLHWFTRMDMVPLSVIELAFDGQRYYTKHNHHNYKITLKRKNSEVIVSLYSFIQKKGIVIEATDRQTKTTVMEIADNIIDMKNKIKKIYSNISIESQNVFDDI